MRKKTIIICLVTLALVLIVGVLFATIILSTNEAHIPEPEITYGEFPVRIEYTVDGKAIAIEDVFVCKYEGVQKSSWLEEFNTGISFQRLWSGSLENHDDSIVLYSNDEIYIDFVVGSADYYMGDIDLWTTYPCFRAIENSQEISYCKTFLAPADLLDYGIEIIDCVLPEPIKNSFQ